MLYTWYQKPKLLATGSGKLLSFISPNTIQNGVDAVAIYQASAADFPDRTLAYVDETLVDVLLYRTTQSDGASLKPIFSAFNPDIEIITEKAAKDNDPESIQRNNDGSYFVGTPTPRQLNDGSGIVLNGITISFTQTQYNDSIGIVSVVAKTRVVTRYLNGLMADTSIASICSVTFMEASSAPIPDPILPAHIRAVITGPISRTMAMPTMEGIHDAAPNSTSVGLV